VTLATPPPHLTSLFFSKEVQLCRLFCLPDLNQTVPYVRQTLLDWVSYLVTTYDFDGIRIDTVPEVSKDFWAGTFLPHQCLS